MDSVTLSFSGSDSEHEGFMHPPPRNVNVEDEFGPGNQMICMLQQQQAVIQEVLKGQEALKLRQESIEQKLLPI